MYIICDCICLLTTGNKLQMHCYSPSLPNSFDSELVLREHCLMPPICEESYCIFWKLCRSKPFAEVSQCRLGTHPDLLCGGTHLRSLF